MSNYKLLCFPKPRMRPNTSISKGRLLCRVALLQYPRTEITIIIHHRNVKKLLHTFCTSLQSVNQGPCVYKHIGISTQFEAVMGFS